jgi:adenylate cyclase
MKKYPVVLASRPSDKTKNVPLNPGAAIINPDYFNTLLPAYGGIIANITQLESLSVGSGIVSTEPEVDGVTRRIPTVAVVDGVLYPSLGLETLRVLAGDKSFQIKLQPNGIEKMRIPKFGPISTDNEGRIWIDWAQKNKTFSVTEMPIDLDGAVVIVDVTATGIANPVATSQGATHPGGIQAAVLGTLLAGTNIERPDYLPALELLGTVICAIMIIILSRWIWIGLGATALSLIAIVPATMYAYAQYHMLVDVTMPAIVLTLIALQVYGIKFIREFLEKQAIRKQFAGYASPTVVRMLQENPSLIKYGMKREVSICFSDLRGFTPLGESFGDDVKGLTRIMNGYMDAITQPILDSDGMVIKYIGDASMHIHNAPIEDKYHPRTAVRTGLNMLKAVKKFNEQIVADGRPPIGMGAGINTGLGYIGEMGSTARHSYDILGDAVSTAARIESKCKEYGCLLLVGGATVESCADNFFFLKIDDLAVKGKSVGITIYTVLETNAGAMSEYLLAKESHDSMHEAYRSQKFENAIDMCNALMGEFDGKMDKYHAMWIEHCEFQLTQELPSDWNGVFIATSK